jgi:glycosyltransferase involved in cell wall biosynthesis
LWYTNPAEFSAAVDGLLQDARLREALGRNGLAYVRKNYIWGRILDKYDILFNSLS